MRILPVLWFLALSLGALAGERINHEGRILPDPPTISTPLLFSTPAADAVLSSLQLFPRDNAWNERVTGRPLLSNSPTMINQIIADLVELDNSRRSLRAFYEMNYVLVPDAQATQNIRFLKYPEQSDLDGGTYPSGKYPIPANLPVEGWPLETGSLTLEDWQRNLANTPGDRHALIVQPGTGSIWETWEAKLVGTAWQASNGAKFNLNSNALRPDTWTSGDAAGLSLFAGLARYDECARGMVEHALRLVVRRSRKAHVYPATHDASSFTGADYPRMGERLRLKSDFTIPTSWTIYEQAIAKALKKYGAIVADNGGFFSVSVAPDPRFPEDAFAHLSSIDISNFEVVQGAGPTGGPRSPGSPGAQAGPDRFVPWPAAATLAGIATDPDAPQTPVTAQWTQYDGPGIVTFGNAAQAQTTATFSVPGRYTLRLAVDDGVHAVTYDAVVIYATLDPTLTWSGNDAVVRFPSVAGRQYRVERSGDLKTWVNLAASVTGTGNQLQIPHTSALSLGRQFYRVTVLPPSGGALSEVVLAAPKKPAPTPRLLRWRR